MAALLTAVFLLPQSPAEFEKLAGKESCKKWKTSIRREKNDSTIESWLRDATILENLMAAVNDKVTDWMVSIARPHDCMAA